MKKLNPSLLEPVIREDILRIMYVPIGWWIFSCTYYTYTYINLWEIKLFEANSSCSNFIRLRVYYNVVIETRTPNDRLNIETIKYPVLVRCTRHIFVLVLFSSRRLPLSPCIVCTHFRPLDFDHRSSFNKRICVNALKKYSSVMEMAESVNEGRIFRMIRIILTVRTIKLD